MTVTVYQWVFAATSIPLGLVLAHARRSGARWNVPLVVSLLAGTVVHALLSGIDVLVQYEAAVSLLLIAFGIRVKAGEMSRFAAELALSLYLVHGIAIVGFRYVGMAYVPTVVGVALSSIALALLIRRLPFL